MPKLNIDGKIIDTADGLTLIQACGQAGIEIPRFCYHERLSIAGNCRMCLVEVVGMPKPVASCALSVNDLRPGRDGEPPVIKTQSEVAKKARHGVMEFLLINHPLDCPICDQGGECDLQDQAMGYGFDRSRYAENKRAVEDKYIGPLIKTIMTRCIHCTRCIRFMTEVAGVEELGATGRGEDMEITTYLERGMMSEMSGNVIDLCPVGALTSRPYAFKARPWELRKTESIDVMDALGCNIRVDARGREVMRILPRVNDAINEEWLSDKSRYVWDGLKVQRLDRPYVRKGGKLEPATWDEAFAAIAARLDGVSGDRIAALAGDLATTEEMFALKLLMGSLGSPNIDCRQDGAQHDPVLGRASYLFNSRIEGIDHAGAVLLIGTNPRLEGPVLNARIRRRWRATGMQIGLIGVPADLTYPHHYLGAGPDSLAELAAGRSEFLQVLKDAANPMIIVGQAALAQPHGAGVLRQVLGLARDLGVIGREWKGFNILHSAASRVGGLDIGFVPGSGGMDARRIAAAAKTGAIEVVYLLGADEIEMDFGKAFVIYQGSHGDKGAHRADVILPGAAYTEKSGLYVNTEGRVQMAERAVFPPGEAKEDWAIIRALSAHLGRTLPLDSLTQLRRLLAERHPHFLAIDQIVPASTDDLARHCDEEIDMGHEPFAAPVREFYLTNPIARASAIMADLSAMHAQSEKATGTDG